MHTFRNQHCFKKLKNWSSWFPTLKLTLEKSLSKCVLTVTWPLQLLWVTVELKESSANRAMMSLKEYGCQRGETNSRLWLFIPGGRKREETSAVGTATAGEMVSAPGVWNAGRFERQTGHLKSDDPPNHKHILMRQPRSSFHNTLSEFVSVRVISSSCNDDQNDTVRVWGVIVTTNAPYVLRKLSDKAVFLLYSNKIKVLHVVEGVVLCHVCFDRFSCLIVP